MLQIDERDLWIRQIDREAASVEKALRQPAHASMCDLRGKPGPGDGRLKMFRIA